MTTATDGTKIRVGVVGAGANTRARHIPSEQGGKEERKCEAEDWSRGLATRPAMPRSVCPTRNPLPRAG